MAAGLAGSANHLCNAAPALQIEQHFDDGTISVSMLRNVAWCSGLLVGLVLLSPAPVFAAGGSGDRAAPGYVSDEDCAGCHAGHYEGFLDVGMAQSFKRPRHARIIEDFDAEPYFHEPSQRYYRITREDQKLWFERFQIAPDGSRINELELEIDWVLGSGNRTRSYLVQTESGEMYQMPIGWYSEIDAWRMSPGFERGDHLGVQRQVKRECMFCHNAYPEVSAGSDAAFRPHTFPEDLPEGIGCQRCHGPGAQHIARIDENASLKAIREAIVNPAKLPPKRRDDVCFQCHMLPEVAFIGPRVFGRTSYAFRPGQRLSDYIKHMEVEIAGLTREENFQINHHGYRLIQSQCFRQSDNELTCISCHDPHDKPDSGVFRKRVADVCTNCHASPEHAKDIDTQACATCHMPRRRTRDVIHVTMTDHRIARGPFDKESLVAPVRRTTPTIVEARLLDRDNLPADPLPDVYRAIATLQAGGSKQALDFLEGALPAMDEPPLQAVLWLVKGQLERGRVENALAALRYAEQRRAPQWFVSAFRGQAYLKQARYAKAVEELRVATELLPRASQSWYDLGLALFGTGQNTKALEALERSLELQPINPRAWLYRGLVEAERANTDAAIAAMKQALAYEPDYTRAYTELIHLLGDAGNQSEAELYRQHGRRVASQPERLRQPTATQTQD